MLAAARSTSSWYSTMVHWQLQSASVSLRAKRFWVPSVGWASKLGSNVQTARKQRTAGAIRLLITNRYQTQLKKIAQERLESTPRTVLLSCTSHTNRWATHPFPSSQTKCLELANRQPQRPSPTCAVVQVRSLPREHSRMRGWQGNQSNPSQEFPSTFGNCLGELALPACSKGMLSKR